MKVVPTSKKFEKRWPTLLNTLLNIYLKKSKHSFAEEDFEMKTEFFFQISKSLTWIFFFVISATALCLWNKINTVRN